MVDMAKIHGLEAVKKEVMKAWDKASDELHSLTDKQSEMTTKYINMEGTWLDKYKVEDELHTINRAWAVSYGMVNMCSQLFDRINEMIESEYDVDKETA